LTTGPSPPDATGSATASSRAAVLTFYEAVNTAIGTGDSAPLAAVLAPDYAEPDATAALVPGRAALERHLRTLHEISPELRLDATELVDDGDRLIAIVAARGAEQVNALGLPLIAPVLWGQVDVFLVADGRIAQRAGMAAPGMRFERRLETPLDLPYQGKAVLTVQRLSFAPAARLSAPAVDGPRVLVVESGAFAVEVRGSTLDGDLAAAEWFVVPTGAAYEVRNVGPAPAELLEVLVPATTPPPDGGASFAEGVTRRVVAGGLVIPVPRGRATLTIGQLTLVPGARLAWAGPAGPAMLAVEAGTLELATIGASAWVRSATDRTSRSEDRTTLVVGDGARIGTGTGAEIRSAGGTPADILVVTLLEEAEEPIPAG
jgi:mannose-6-phosphate isomerase-like protein (cupin superfamily)